MLRSDWPPLAWLVAEQSAFGYARDDRSENSERRLADERREAVHSRYLTRCIRKFRFLYFDERKTIGSDAQFYVYLRTARFVRVRRD